MATEEPLDPADFVHDPRFNRSFTFSHSAADGRTRAFNVTYADYGHHDDTQVETQKVLLWFPPMLASRLDGITRDIVAKRHKIRVVAIDRPGFGGTDTIEGELRIKICREIILALLKRLNVKHCFIAAHSGGCVYALDMLLHHPEVLDPRQPFLALGAPWILPSHTSSTIMAMVQRLPISLIGNFHHVVRLVSVLGNSKMAASLTIFSQSESPSTDGEVGDGEYANDIKFAQKVRPAIQTKVQAEGVRGISAEALLLLQRVGSCPSWDQWGDYDSLVPEVVKRLQELDITLRLNVYYAEEDIMIGNAGTKGPAWFDGLWNSTEAGDSSVDYHSKIIQAANHDNIWLLEQKPSKELFEFLSNV